MKYKRSKRRGAIFIDVMVGIFVLSLGAASFFALFPVVKKSEIISRQDSIAAQLANRMLEHVQLLKPSEVTAENLLSLGLIDSGQVASPYSFTNIPLDQASGYSPSRLLRNGTATLTVDDLPGDSKSIRVEIEWRSPTGEEKSFITGTILGGYR